MVHLLRRTTCTSSIRSYNEYRDLHNVNIFHIQTWVVQINGWCDHEIAHIPHRDKSFPAIGWIYSFYDMYSSPRLYVQYVDEIYLQSSSHHKRIAFFKLFISIVGPLDLQWTQKTPVESPTSWIVGWKSVTLENSLSGFKENPHFRTGIWTSFQLICKAWKGYLFPGQLEELKSYAVLIPNT